MSLNGLDDAAVVDAYKCAQSEPGGWLLLKYASRDTVELLSRGTAGVGEARTSIESYTEKSPLFGLVQYRRRKVVLKYVPEGTSRLIQVRLTVQFQSILDKFTPHDAVLSIATAVELTEPALSSVCMLQVSAGSLTSSSSSSARRQRLDEITEDAEEGGQTREKAITVVSNLDEMVVARDVTPTLATSTPPRLGKSGPAIDLITPKHTEKPRPKVEVGLLPSLEIDLSRLPRLDSLSSSQLGSSQLGSSQLGSSQLGSSQLGSSQLGSSTLAATVNPTDKALPATPQASSRPNSSNSTVKPPEKIEGEATSKHTRDFSRSSIEPPKSVHSVRPSTAGGASQHNGFTSSAFSAFKPKKKFGPKPHVETPGEVSSHTRTSHRPVANLPTSIRVSNRPSPSVLSSRPGSQHSSRSVPSRFLHPTESSELPPLPSATHVHIASLYAPSRGWQTNSRAASIAPTSNTVTPEKLRLMKALQLRKKNMVLSSRGVPMPTVPDSPSSWTSQTNDTLITENRPDEETAMNSSNQQAPLESSQQPSLEASDSRQMKKDSTDRVTSPTSMTETSEEPSTQASSFTDDLRPTTSSNSLSTDTGSSVTPKPIESAKNEVDDSKSPKPDETDQVSSGEMPNTPSQEQPTTSPTLSRDTDPSSSGPAAADCSIPANTEKEDPRDLDDAHNAAAAASTPDAQKIPPAMSPESRNSLATVIPDAAAVEKKDGAVPVATNANDGSDANRGQKRKNLRKSLHVATSPDLSELSDDDDFMEELRCATVEQAKPVSVARSAITPIYSKGSSDKLREMSRNASSTGAKVDPNLSSPERSRTGSSRSFSGALPQWMPPAGDSPPLPLAKKGPLSNGISKRIKALEVFSTRDSSGIASRSPSTASQHGGMSVGSVMKRTSLLSHHPAPTASTNGTASKKLHSPTASHTSEGSLSPQYTHLSHKKSSPSENDQPERKRDSISITARIVRDPKHADISETDPTLSTTLDLQLSPLTIDPETSSTISITPTTPQDAYHQSTEITARSPKLSRSSFGSHRPTPARLATSDSTASRLSLSSTHKKASGGLPKSNSDKSSLADVSRDSRASRLIKRMTNLTTGSRKTLVGAFSSKKETGQTPSIMERSESPVESLRTESFSHVVDIGNVNVQFPDTLLWKRRFMRIDDHGYLIFTPPAMEAHGRSITRKFHLSNFKKPALPDKEREEMAWSIILELEDGSGIQCACESKYLQGQVLTTLVDAHNAYKQLYGS